MVAQFYSSNSEQHSSIALAIGYKQFVEMRFKLQKMRSPWNEVKFKLCHMLALVHFHFFVNINIKQEKMETSTEYVNYWVRRAGAVGTITNQMKKNQTLSDVYRILSNEWHFICKINDRVSNDTGKHAHIIFIRIHILELFTQQFNRSHIYSTQYGLAQQAIYN